MMILTLAGLILAKDQLRRSIAASGVTQSAMLVGEKYTQEVLAGDSGWARKVLRMERWEAAVAPLSVPGLIDEAFHEDGVPSAIPFYGRGPLPCFPFCSCGGRQSGFGVGVSHGLSRRFCQKKRSGLVFL